MVAVPCFSIDSEETSAEVTSPTTETTIESAESTEDLQTASQLGGVFVGIGGWGRPGIGYGGWGYGRPGWGYGRPGWGYRRNWGYGGR